MTHSPGTPAPFLAPLVMSLILTVAFDPALLFAEVAVLVGLVLATAALRHLRGRRLARLEGNDVPAH